MQGLTLLGFSSVQGDGSIASRGRIAKRSRQAVEALWLEKRTSIHLPSIGRPQRRHASYVMTPHCCCRQTVTQRFLFGKIGTITGAVFAGVVCPWGCCAVCSDRSSQLHTASESRDEPIRIGEGGFAFGGHRYAGLLMGIDIPSEPLHPPKLSPDWKSAQNATGQGPDNGAKAS